MSRKTTQRCCLCGKEFVGMGHNPYPLNDDVNARCCAECNLEVVVPARIDAFLTYKGDNDGSK